MSRTHFDLTLYGRRARLTTRGALTCDGRRLDPDDELDGPLGIYTVRDLCAQAAARMHLQAREPADAADARAAQWLADHGDDHTHPAYQTARERRVADRDLWAQADALLAWATQDHHNPPHGRGCAVRRCDQSAAPTAQPSLRSTAHVEGTTTSAGRGRSQ